MLRAVVHVVVVASVDGNAAGAASPALFRDANGPRRHRPWRWVASECGIQAPVGDARGHVRAAGVAAAVASADVVDYGLVLGDSLVMTADSHARVVQILRDACLRRA